MNPSLMATFLVVFAAFCSVSICQSEDTDSWRGTSASYLSRNATFTDLKELHPKVFVAFLTPWCYWSRLLIPEFDSASMELSSSDPRSVSLVKVDCMVNEQVCVDAMVFEFPTLRLYSADGYLTYTGKRSITPMVNWVNNNLQRDIRIRTPEQLRDLKATHEGAVILIAKKLSPRQASACRGVTEKYPETLLVHISGSVDMKRFISKLGWPSYINSPDPAVFLLNPHSGEAPIVTYGESLTDTTALSAFVREYVLPAVSIFDNESSSSLMEDGRPILVLFQKVPNAELEYILALVAQAHRHILLTTKSGVDNVFEKRLLQMVAADEELVPALRILTINPLGDAVFHPALKYRPEIPDGSPLASKDVKKFVEAYLSGTMSPYYKSEPVPDPSQDAVVTIVGTTFDSIVRKTDKDVFVVFYAPWCGHCRKFEPVLLQVARILKGSVVVGKIDSTQNEVPGVYFAGYPTLMIFPGNAKSHPITHKGERTVEGVLQFIQQNGSGKINIDSAGKDTGRLDMVFEEL